MYYNCKNGCFRCNVGAQGWTDCLGQPKPNTRRTIYGSATGTTTGLTLNGDVATVTAPGGSGFTAGGVLNPRLTDQATSAAAGSDAGMQGSFQISLILAPLLQTEFGPSTTANIRMWTGLTNQTIANMDSANAAGHYAAFCYDTSAGDANWKCITKDGTTQNIQDSGVAPSGSGGVQKFEVSYSNTPSVTFKINGNVVCTSTANLPGVVQLYAWNNSVHALAASAITGRTGYVYLETSF